MTGYGKADAHYKGKVIHAEVRSLNSKNMDLTTRVAPLYREKEIEIRQTIATALVRGKVDFTLWVERTDGAATATINEQAVANYAAQIEAICQNCTLPRPADFWEVVLRLPEATQAPLGETLDAGEWAVALQCIREALDHLTDFRRQEGNALEKMFAEKLDNIAALLAQVEPFEKSRVEKIRQRLEERLAELRGVDYDKNRLEQELIFYIEKLDISEEKQRLSNHLKYFRETMEQGHGQGKKLGFIAQEMGREINTTGSKSNQAEMQNIVVKMKDELEQIKEQVLNAL